MFSAASLLARPRCRGSSSVQYDRVLTVGRDGNPADQRGDGGIVIPPYGEPDGTGARAG